MGRRPSFTTLPKPSPTRTVQTSSDGRGPVRKDIARVPDTPALAEEERGDGLQVHLVRVGPAVLAADRPPLLWKHAEEELLREVAHHDTGPSLPLALAREMRGRRRKDEGRPGS